jgi:hypothetical protein
MANSARPEAAMLSTKAAVPPPSTRKGRRGTKAPSANAHSDPSPAATGEPIVSAESPISSRTKVSMARSGSFMIRFTIISASGRDRPLAS